MSIKVLLQTTIVPTVDDWSIARFSLLTDFLRRQTDSAGNPVFTVTARDREAEGDPQVISGVADCLTSCLSPRADPRKQLL